MILIVFGSDDENIDDRWKPAFARCLYRRANVTNGRELEFVLNQVISFGLTVNTKQGGALVVLEFDQQGEQKRPTWFKWRSWIRNRLNMEILQGEPKRWLSWIGNRLKFFSGTQPLTFLWLHWRRQSTTSTTDKSRPRSLQKKPNGTTHILRG